MAHGVSVYVTLRLPKEREPARVSQLLELSASSVGFMWNSIGALLVGGIAAGFTGHFWGQGWIWAAIVVLVAVMAAMYAMGTTLGETAADDLRRDGGGNARRSRAAQFEEILRSKRPYTIAAIGFVGLLADPVADDLQADARVRRASAECVPTSGRRRDGLRVRRPALLRAIADRAGRASRSGWSSRTRTKACRTTSRSTRTTRRRSRCSSAISSKGPTTRDLRRPGARSRRVLLPLRRASADGRHPGGRLDVLPNDRRRHRRLADRVGRRRGRPEARETAPRQARARRGARRLRRLPAAAADRPLRGGGGRAREEGRRDRRADRGDTGRIDPRGRDQARRRPDRRRQPRHGAGDPVPARERARLDRARRAVRPVDRGHAPAAPAHGNPLRRTCRILAGTDGSGTATEAVRKAYTLASMYAGTGHPRARRRSARRRHQAGGGRVDPARGRRGREANRRRRPRPADLRARRGGGRAARRGREQGDVGRPAVPRLRAQQGRARGALRRLDREDRGSFGGRPRGRPRRPRERGRPAARGLSRRGRAHVRALASLHPHGLHGRLERLRQDLGLPVPRVEVRLRRIGGARARRRSRSNAWEGRRAPGTQPRRRRATEVGRHRSRHRAGCPDGADPRHEEGAVRHRGREPRRRHGGRDPARGRVRRRGRADRRRAHVPVRASAAVEDVPPR